MTMMTKIKTMKIKELIQIFLTSDNLKSIFVALSIVGGILYIYSFYNYKFYYFIYVDFLLFGIVGFAYGLYSKYVGNYLYEHYPELYNKYKKSLESLLGDPKVINSDIIQDIPKIKNQLDSTALRLIQTYKAAFTYSDYSFFIIFGKVLIWVLYVHLIVSK